MKKLVVGLVFLLFVGVSSEIRSYSLFLDELSYSKRYTRHSLVDDLEMRTPVPHF